MDLTLEFFRKSLYLARERIWGRQSCSSFPYCHRIQPRKPKTSGIHLTRPLIVLHNLQAPQNSSSRRKTGRWGTEQVTRKKFDAWPSLTQPMRPWPSSKRTFVLHLSETSMARQTSNSKRQHPMRYAWCCSACMGALGFEIWRNLMGSLEFCSTHHQTSLRTSWVCRMDLVFPSQCHSSIQVLSPSSHSSVQQWSKQFSSSF